jgi:hypothetical protein
MLEMIDHLDINDTIETFENPSFVLFGFQGLLGSELRPVSQSLFTASFCILPDQGYPVL